MRKTKLPNNCSIHGPEHMIQLRIKGRRESKEKPADHRPGGATGEELPVAPGTGLVMVMLKRVPSRGCSCEPGIAKPLRDMSSIPPYWPLEWALLSAACR
jgi:hypothetical protein